MKDDEIKKWRKFTANQVLATEAGEPVPGFPIKFEWHTGPWKEIFDLQIDRIQGDIRRARVDDKLIVYLSCPISARGGSYGGTNVDIARFTERALMDRWGERFWILNPAQYQLELKAGAGLMEQHAETLHINLEELRKLSKKEKKSAPAPSGGDYLRMWTKVLVENDKSFGFEVRDRVMLNTGQHFDAFYFLGPRDAHAFFLQNGANLTSGIETYFARRFATDGDFRDAYSVEGALWSDQASHSSHERRLQREWERKRSEFFRYYGMRASANFSMGSHDEWEIFRQLNRIRRDRKGGDVSQQLAGYFDGGQLDPASTETIISPGYAVSRSDADRT